MKTGARRPVPTAWDDNCPHCRSPFRKTIWKPLMRCTTCGMMYRLPPPVLRREGEGTSGKEEKTP